jgi:hypothetical protein
VSIEHCTTGYELPEAAVRAKLRHAPAWFRAEVDSARRQRGLPVLFAEKAIVRLAPVAVKPAPPKIARTLCAVAAPGISNPCTVRGDLRRCPEEILPSAWEDVAVDVRAGRHFTITDGHGGRVIATSADRHFRWKIEPKVGLVFELDLLTANEVVWPGPMDCSIGMRPTAFTHRYSKRGWIRQITAMRLDHVALLRPSQRRDGAYPLATVRSAKPGEAARVAARLWLETLLALPK